ncbi:MAG: hypothetical protein WDA74_06415 [Spirochaetota bacterium]
MSITKDIKRSFLKYTEKVVNKTDSLTRIAKLNIEIKKALAEIEDFKTRIGSNIVDLHESGKDSIMFNDKSISDDLHNINNLKAKINEIKKTLEEIKSKQSIKPDAEEKKEDKNDKKDDSSKTENA